MIMTTNRTKLASEQRKDSIINSAINVMARNSIESTSMNDIADADGISRTLLYKYFKNKYQILCAIVDTRLNVVIQLMEELFDTIRIIMPDLEITLPIIWKLMKKRIEENQRLLVLFLRERVNIPHYLQKMVEACNLPKGENYIKKVQKILGNIQVVDNLTNYFQRCKDAGNLNENLTASECTKLFLSLIWTPISLTPLNDSDEVNIELENLVEIQIKVLLYGLLPKKI